ncbi:protein kinase [Spirulina sp. CS-785/01]|uniref:protein kinase domain-containing protein n=1 Tax=Spirulina sp. CS-785/01 TaxID=3021716 RepID=UPI00232F0020|nr:protein kinase [Spirulina sp. CS-785/01]MDB9315214.1 protein kinase [Spirulina sp. CS-785/01]
MMPQVLKNRYHILRPLSSGGFGNTFLAEDSDLPSGRRCVIKQLKPITDDPQSYQLVQERFQREAVILEDLGQGHSQIPALYAYFEEEGLFYLVEEWVEGVTLTEFLQQQGTVSESSVREVLTGILPVLDYMHSKHIIHRDIKPDNIIVRHSDHKPVLIDLGAVKEAMGTIMTVSGNSNHSIVIGTPGFMPSEQSAGRPVYGSDIYSLGMTMIYLLTRKPPQELQSDPATGEITWRPDAPTVSPTLANILDQAIQSHPRDRFSTAKEMLTALQPGASSQPTQPLPVPETTVSGPSTQSPTVVASNPSPPPPKPPLPDWQKAIITGSVVGIFVLGAVVLVRPLMVSSSGESDNTSTTTEATKSTETDPDSSNSANNTQNQQTASNPNPSTPTSATAEATESTEKDTDSSNSPNNTQNQQTASNPNPSTPSASISPQSSQTYTNNNVNSNRSESNNTLTSTPSPSPTSALPAPIGWIRIGAVNNTSVAVGNRLFNTSQPVTITPSVIPQIGQEVQIINNVNYREFYPQPPQYDLASKKGVLFKRQKVIILDIETFIDSTVSSTYTVVWAKIGLP